jgi:hypothetical protein
LALVVEVAAEETGINLRNVVSMAFKRADRQRGCEANSSFSIEREVDARGKSTIAPERDPPPNLVIESEVSQSILPQPPI